MEELSPNQWTPGRITGVGSRTPEEKSYLKRNLRLTRSTDFERVRRYGKAYAHPLLVLICQPNDLERFRFGIAAGRSVGRAVERNRAKRLLRAALGSLLPEVLPGWDVVALARRPLPHAGFQEVHTALARLLRRAGILTQESPPSSDPPQSS